MVAVCAAACSVSAFDYSVRADGMVQRERIARQSQIVHGTAPAPDRYRVLVPFALQPLISLGATVVGPDSALKKVYDAYYLAALTLMLWVLTIYLRQWFSLDLALAGALLVAAVLPITLRQHFLQPWSLLEPTLLTLGLMCAYRGFAGAIVPLAILASLNRETGVLVPLAYLFAAGRDARAWRAGGAAVAVSIAIFVGLRYALGPATPYVTLAQIWDTNSSREGTLAAVGNIALFLGGTGWILAAIGFRSAPAFTRRAALVSLLYLPVIAVWGVWYEVRLLMPLYPLFLPFVLSAIRPPAEAVA